MKKTILCRNCSDETTNEEDFCTWKCQCVYWGVETEEDIERLNEEWHENGDF